MRTLFDVYPDREQQVEDPEWLRYAGMRGWPVLTADPRIRRRAEELAEVEQCAVRMFALPRGHLTGAEQVHRFMHNWNRILQACAKPGPRIYTVYANTVRLTYPKQEGPSLR